MTESTNEGSKGSNAGRQPRTSDRRSQLALDEKISTLIQVEIDYAGDAVNSVVSACIESGGRPGQGL